MKNAPALIVIIIAIVAIMIAIGLVIANLTHKYAVNKAKEMALEMKAEEEAEEAESELFPVYEEYFALQIMASNNYSKVEHLQNKLNKAGYLTKITKVKREGEILYRLRLEELYVEDEAIELGETLKSTYPEITSYWLEERKTELVQRSKQEISRQLPETGRQESTTTAPDTRDIGSDEEQFEIQLMATVDYDKINRISTSLEEKGYPTKIIVVKKGATNFYRLRIDGSFPEEEANDLGKEIVQASPFITDFWLDEKLTGSGIEKPVKTTTTKPRTPVTRGEYKVQLLANPNRSFVEEKKRLLEAKGYPAEVTSANVKGTRYYRLRTANAYTRNSAEKIGQEIKDNVNFITDFWVTKVEVTTPEPVETVQVQKQTKQEAKKPEPKKEKAEKTEETESIKHDKAVTMICNTDNVNIRIGPGTYYALDPIGKLMKGITVFVLEEKNGWARFTITRDDDAWSGWVNKKYLD